MILQQASKKEEAASIFQRRRVDLLLGDLSNKFPYKPPVQQQQQQQQQQQPQQPPQQQTQQQTNQAAIPAAPQPPQTSQPSQTQGNDTGLKPRKYFMSFHFFSKYLILI